MQTDALRRITGRIAYRDGGDIEVGREDFELIDHGDGHLLRALCVMDDVGLLRDVTLALDTAWRPLDGFCRIHQHGRVDAATHITVTGSEAGITGLVRRGDRLEAIDGRLVLPGPPAYLGLHPLQGDALIVACLRDLEAGRTALVEAVTNSHSPDGEEAVGLHAVPIVVTYVGPETIEVAAGRFAARHFTLQWHEDWPPADLWVRAGDAVFLRMRWSLIERWYELVALDDPSA